MGSMIFPSLDERLLAYFSFEFSVFSFQFSECGMVDSPDF